MSRRSIFATRNHGQISLCCFQHENDETGEVPFADVPVPGSARPCDCALLVSRSLDPALRDASGARIVGMSPIRRKFLAFAGMQVMATALLAGDAYPPPANAPADLQHARERVKSTGKLLMVIFGGNWCEDCRVLHAKLLESPVREYVDKHFEVVSINIGEMNANLQIAKDLGVDLKQGVPAAGFFGPDGKPVGVTHGELEPSRHYDARQILTFVRKVAEEHVIEKPK